MARRVALVLTAVMPVCLCACAAETVTPFKPQGSEARIRVVNASADTVSVRVNATVVSASLTYGKGTGCFSVNATESGLSVRFPAQTVDFGSSGGLDFLPGESSNVFATSYGTAFSLIRVPTETTFTSGQARLQVLNAGGTGPVDVHVTGVGSALGVPNATGVAAGGWSSSFLISTGQHQVRLTDAGTLTVVLDLGNREWIADERQVLVMAPPAPGTTSARAFFWTGAGC